jgi:hypothetical protein
MCDNCIFKATREASTRLRIVDGSIAAKVWVLHSSKIKGVSDELRVARDFCHALLQKDYSMVFPHAPTAFDASHAVCNMERIFASVLEAFQMVQARNMHKCAPFACPAQALQKANLKCVHGGRPLQAQNNFKKTHINAFIPTTLQVMRKQRQ